MILGDSLSYMDTFGKLDSSKTSRVTQAISSCDSFFLLFSLIVTNESACKCHIYQLCTRSKIYVGLSD